MSEAKEVYRAIVNVQTALAKEGIAKDRTCTQGATYKFRGIDDIYNALAPFLAAAELCILPRMISRAVVERTSAKGNALFYTTVDAEFDFVSAKDSSSHTVKTYGEAMDSGDKGTNKAMSAAYKYAAFQTFCIPTEGDNDAENQTHTVESKNKPAPNKEKNTQGGETSNDRKTLEAYLASIDKSLVNSTSTELEKNWRTHVLPIMDRFPADQQNELHIAYKDTMRALIEREGGKA